MTAHTPKPLGDPISHYWLAVSMAKAAGERIPEGWALDADGNPTTDPEAALAGSLVSMGGYNSVIEILSAGVPALIVPREVPRVEQLLRATRLAACVPDVECCRVTDLVPGVFDAFVERALESSRTGHDLDLKGVASTVSELGRTMKGGGAALRIGRVARVI